MALHPQGDFSPAGTPPTTRAVVPGAQCGCVGRLRKRRQRVPHDPPLLGRRQRSRQHDQTCKAHETSLGEHSSSWATLGCSIVYRAAHPSLEAHGDLQQAPVILL